MGKKFVARIVVDQKYAGDFMAMVDDLGEEVVEEFQIVAMRKARVAPKDVTPALPKPKKTAPKTAPKKTGKSMPLKGSALDDFIVAAIAANGSVTSKEASEWAFNNGRSPDAASPRLHALKARGWIEPVPGKKGTFQFVGGKAPANHVPLSERKAA